MVNDSPGHKVTSLSLHRIGSASSPFVDLRMDRCWNKATAFDESGTESVTVVTLSSPSRRVVACTSIVAVGNDCNAAKSAYWVSGVRYQFECFQSSTSFCVESQ